MATEEWVSRDSEIWDFDFTDDFIWIPTSDIDGVGIWVANKIYWSFTAKKEPWTYVADKQPWMFVANRR